MNKPWYLAGPMTGYAQDNLPAFLIAADALRNNEFEIITPAELDGAEAVQKVLDDPKLTFNDVAGTTWGSALARDVEIISNACGGVIFLDGWEKSRGARLEAFVGLLNNLHFARYLPGGNIERMAAATVLTKITRQTFLEVQNAGS